MSRFLTKVSVAIRILQRDRDVSARASHLAKRVISLQAEMGKFLISTVLERNIMSTKTTFKRVALVVAAAVSFGGISAVSAHATDNAVLRFVSGDGSAAAPYSTGNGVAGAYNYVTVEVRGTPAADFVVTTDSTFGAVASGLSATVSSDRKSFTAGSNTGSFQVMTPAVGTVTVSYWVRTAGVLASTAAETVKVTVNAAAAHGVFSAAKSTVYGYTGDTTTAASITATTDAAFSVTSDSADASTKIASFAITQNDANGDVMTDGAAKAVTVYTTGGKLHDGSSYVGSYASVAAGTAAVKVFQLSPNGVVGTATVTVGINGVTAAVPAATEAYEPTYEEPSWSFPPVV